MNSSSVKEILDIGLSRVVIDMAIAHVGNDDQRFAELMNLMLTSKYPISLRAAWAVSIIADENPYLLDPYIDQLIEGIEDFAHPALTRCTMKYLSFNSIPVSKLGMMLNLSYKYLLDIKTPIAIRVYAMQIIFNIAQKEPDLKEELRLTIESLYETGSAGFKNRASKLLRRL